MIGRRLRLSRGSEFNKIYKFGKSAYGENVLCRANTNKLQHSKFAVIVSKKISKKAVIRNRIKRRINEIIRKNWQTVPVGYNIVVIAKTDSSKLNNLKLQQDVFSCIEKATKND